MDNMLSLDLLVPRGIPNLAPLKLEMKDVYDAENRLHEVSVVSPVTAPELMGYYNSACNLTTKYISWLDYEILMAEKYYQLAKATVILDKLPEEWAKRKSSGMKQNEDFRDALIARDSECEARKDALNCLIATRALLDAKAKTFIRAFSTCKATWERRFMSGAVPNLTANQDSTNNFMGKTSFPK